MSKLHIISDKNKKSSKIKNLLIKKIKSSYFKKENLIIVIGGDGFMLQTLKRNKNYRKHFYGINSGNYGFLMNKFSSNDIIMGFLLGVPQLAFGFICVTIGTKTTKAVTVGLLMLLETIFAPIWVWIFLNEVPPTSVFMGGAIIISAVILKSFDKSLKISNKNN